MRKYILALLPRRRWTSLSFKCVLVKGEKKAVMYLFKPFKKEGGLLTTFPNIPTCRCPKGGIDCKDQGPTLLKREAGRERVLCSLLHGLKWVLGHFANSGFNCVLRRRGEKPLKAFLFIAGYLGDSV